MDLSAITGPDQSSLSAAAGLPTQEMGKEAFMELLVAQLKNQDPLEPASNQEFIGQLASFSSLEQLENVNDNIMTMVLLQQSNALLSQLTESSDMIGQSVSWMNPETGASGTGIVQSVIVEGGTAFLDVDGQNVALLDITTVNGTEDSGDESDSDDAVDEADETGETGDDGEAA